MTTLRLVWRHPLLTHIAIDLLTVVVLVFVGLYVSGAL